MPVPYRGGGVALSDLIAGHLDLFIGTTAFTLPQLQFGAIRAVLQTGAVRVPVLPDVMTLIEGGFPGFEAYGWWGLFAPANSAGDHPPLRRRIRGELA